MRYREVSGVAEVSRDVAVVMDFIGVSLFRGFLEKIRRDLTRMG